MKELQLFTIRAESFTFLLPLPKVVPRSVRVPVVLLEEGTDSLHVLGVPAEIRVGAAVGGNVILTPTPRASGPPQDTLAPLKTTNRLSEGSLTTELWLFCLDTLFSLVVPHVWDKKQGGKQLIFQTSCLLQPGSRDVDP